MKIGIACDHRGYEKKELLKNGLLNYEVIDYGCYSDKSVDYPGYAFKLSNAVVNNEVDLGIILCGTGIGVSIACNKVKGIRCAKISNINEAKSAKEHNNANIIAFSADNNSYEDIINMIKVFIESTQNKDEKYLRRIKQVEKYEETNEC